VEEAAVVEQAFASLTAAAEMRRRGRLLLAALFLVEAVWLSVIGFSLYWLLT